MWKGSAKPDGGVCDAHLYHQAWRLGPSGAPSWRTCSRAAAQTTWPSADLQGATHTITLPQTHCWHMILYTWVGNNFITSIRFDYPLYIYTHTHTLTDLLLLRDAHDPHGLHGLQVHVSVLLSRDRDVPVGQESVLIVALQTQFSWWTEKQKQKQRVSLALEELRSDKPREADTHSQRSLSPAPVSM